MMKHEHSFFPKNIDAAFLNQLKYTCIAYTTYFLFGIMRGYPNYLGKQLKSPDSIIVIKSKEEFSLIASLSIFPNPFGSILAGYLMDKRGRRITLQLSMLVFTAGYVFITCSHNLMMLYAGNIIVGVAIGMGACSTIYVAEICSVQNRCFLLSVLEIYFSLGLLVAYVATYYLQWNLAALIFTIISMISLFLLLFIPETPYWLLRKKRLANAIASFTKLRGNLKNAEVDEEFKTIATVLHEEPAKEEERNSRNYFLILHDNLEPFLILVAFHLLLQGAGYTVLITFFEDFIHEINIPYSEYIIIGFPVSSFVASFFTPLSVNYWPRRETTVLSGAGMMMSLLVLGFYYSCLGSVKGVRQFWVIVPVSYYVFMTSCTIGVLTLSQCMISELFPTEVRGLMCGITEAVGTALGGLSVLVYPTLCSMVDKSTLLYVFSFFALLTILFGKYLLPETYGKTLDEIQTQYFNKHRYSQPEEKYRKKGIDERV